VATSNSQTFTDAKQATAKAVSEAVASACGSGNVNAAASAAAQAVATATAKAFAESSATVTVEGELNSHVGEARCLARDFPKFSWQNLLHAEAVIFRHAAMTCSQSMPFGFCTAQ
jgi:hypothetical protein